MRGLVISLAQKRGTVYLYPGMLKFSNNSNTICFNKIFTYLNTMPRTAR